ncbi:MAG: hypothetical protein HYX34_04430 [Actinobacteria bacterium]|nr:hypothetical protein [Actinomycetota bacterium]
MEPIFDWLARLGTAGAAANVRRDLETDRERTEAVALLARRVDARSGASARPAPSSARAAA